MSVCVLRLIFSKSFFFPFLYPSVDTEDVTPTCIFHALLIIHLCSFKYAAMKVSVKSSKFSLKT